MRKLQKAYTDRRFFSSDEVRVRILCFVRRTSISFDHLLRLGAIKTGRYKDHLVTTRYMCLWMLITMNNFKKSASCLNQYGVVI